MAAFLLGRFFTLVFLAIFWYVVAHSNGSAVDFKPLIAYFLVATAVKDLTFSTETKFGKSIQLAIKTGEINNYLVKPIGIVSFLFFSYVGSNGLGVIYAVVTLILGLVILPPLGWLNVLGFIVFLFLALVVAVCINVFIGLMSFYSPEADGFRNASNHIIKILSGALIPIYFFPVFWQNAVFLTPFPVMVFLPVYVLQNQLAVGKIIFLSLVAVGWSVALIMIISLMWRQALKKYEGVGI
jgi:ABC-type uncharacterized transport system permease subunit